MFVSEIYQCLFLSIAMVVFVYSTEILTKFYDKEVNIVENLVIFAVKLGR